MLLPDPCTPTQKIVLSLYSVSADGWAKNWHAQQNWYTTQKPTRAYFRKTIWFVRIFCRVFSNRLAIIPIHLTAHYTYSAREVVRRPSSVQKDLFGIPLLTVVWLGPQTAVFAILRCSVLLWVTVDIVRQSILSYWFLSSSVYFYLFHFYLLSVFASYIYMYNVRRYS